MMALVIPRANGRIAKSTMRHTVSAGVNAHTAAATTPRDIGGRITVTAAAMNAIMRTRPAIAAIEHTMPGMARAITIVRHIITCMAVTDGSMPNITLVMVMPTITAMDAITATRTTMAKGMVTAKGMVVAMGTISRVITPDPTARLVVRRSIGSAIITNSVTIIAPAMTIGVKGATTPNHRILE